MARLTPASRIQRNYHHPVAIEIPQATTDERTERQAVDELVRRATVLRMLVALAVFMAGVGPALAPDQVTYHQGAADLAAYWGGDSAAYPDWVFRIQSYASGYFVVIGLIYYVLGAHILLPMLLNSWVGGYSVRLSYHIARYVVGEHGGAMRAARLTAYLPSMVLWSSLNLRDIWVVFIILVAVRAALDLQAGFRVGTASLLAASVVSLVYFRYYLVLPVGGSIVVAFLTQRTSSVFRNAGLGMLAAAALIYAQQSRGVESDLSTFERLQKGRQDTSFEGTSLGSEADVSSLGRAIAFLPVGLSYFLLSPFPWQLRSVLQAVTLPEMLFIYTLVPSMVRGLLRLARERFRAVLVVLLITGGICFGYALGQANVGTAYRQRAQVIPFLMMFAAVGALPREPRLTRRAS